VQRGGGRRIREHFKTAAFKAVTMMASAEKPLTEASGAGWSIRGKLISLFVIIKVVPLLSLAWFAWQGQTWLATQVSKSVVSMFDEMGEIARTVAEGMEKTAAKALDDSARESLERVTTDTARAVAVFLYERDSDIRAAGGVPRQEKDFRRFMELRTRIIERHHPWVLNPTGTAWVPGPEATPRYYRPTATPSVEDNKRSFNYRQPDEQGIVENRPLFLEMTFVGLDGREQVKATTSPLMSPELRDVSRRDQTFARAETYFQHLKDLKPGEIYVSDVIGAYLPSRVIGPYTPAAAAKRNMAYTPEESAYAGTENPVGKRFRGLVRWATPVVENGAVIGWLTLALDHDHLMEFTEHIQPTNERYTPIYDAQSGNYAFIWDYKGRSVVHPRHYFIVGYDPETGDPAPPWMDAQLYAEWRASGKSAAEFLATAPTFLDQSLKKKGAAEQVRDGFLGLDCRYLNHAPQCSGWMDLTQQGGSGSFEILWSGIWKLTTAAAIPYYTGPYGQSKRGFGFVTIGANVDDFHRAATESKKAADAIVAERSAELKQQLDDVITLIRQQVDATARQLSGSTAVMTLMVIGVAIWMASLLTRRVTTIVGGIRRFEEGELDHRLPVQSRDEMGRLALSFNSMADRVEESIERLKEAKVKAEEASRMKTQFLSNVSHELRTPLNGILGFAEMLRDEAENDETRENAEVIERSSRHLLELVNSILDVAKIEAGAMAVRCAAISPAAALRNAAAVHAVSAAAKGLVFSVVVDDDAPETVWADGTRLQQVLHNLIHNAVKFTAKGEVAISLRRTENGGAAFIVRDTGVGVPEEMRTAIFEAFRQVEDFITRGQGGAGLGLTLARSLTLAMGGRLELQSEIGVGSVFTVILPPPPVSQV
jgi:two-component system, NarL family, sensor histidine kinase BarA